MQSTTAIWVKDTRFRMIKTYHHENGSSVLRSYGDGHKILKDWLKQISLYHLVLVLSSSGREICNDNIPRENVRKIVESFKNSAEKANFEYLGVVKKQ